MNRTKLISPRTCDLKVEEVVIQFHAGLPVDTLTHQEGQLVGILTRRWHSDYSLGGKTVKQNTKQVNPQTLAVRIPVKMYYPPETLPINLCPL